MTAQRTLAPGAAELTLVERAARQPIAEVFGALGTSPAGLSSAEATDRLARTGSNAVASHRARPLAVLLHQVRSPLLGLLVGAAAVSYLLGQHSDAVIIAVILALSVLLGFVNEYRAEAAAEALHSQIPRHVVVVRDGRPVTIDPVDLVPGDVVRLHLGDIVPADLRLFEAVALTCDESTLTGESLPVAKDTAEAPPGSALGDLTGCALMGSVVTGGTGAGIVVGTAARTSFGRIAAGLQTHQLDTEFQVGLRRFSMLLVRVAAVLTGSIFVANLLLHRPLIDALLFSLAIAVGITPQLLPAVVSTSLATGSRALRRRKVLVKRLVCIEDLGDIEVLFTDKTGTLTEGRLTFSHALTAPGTAERDAIGYGLLCRDGAVSSSSLDDALGASPAAAFATGLAAVPVLQVLPFDHQRRMVSVLVPDGGDGGRLLITKGAPEEVLRRCADGSAGWAGESLQREFAAGHRVVAVAVRPLPGTAAVSEGDERNLRLLGLLVFLDPPKAGAADAVRRLARLGIAVKVVTGDNALVGGRIATDLGIADGPAVVLGGTDVERLDDAGLAAALPHTQVFARVSPEQKARIVRLQRQSGRGVAFLGDGVNDALALHAADVGISVDTAVDVAKDAADVILLEKDLDVLADGVGEGRRVFANTMKYVLMGTSSNFGNMFSAAGASLLLSFLPMLPSQILLNNLLYDSSQLAIATDRADAAQLRRPSHWDIGFIRRFMLFFGALSSIFDFATFGLMLWILHAGPAEFRTGWFLESLATQTLVIFAVRTRTVPFFRSRPSLPLALAAAAVVGVAVVLPYSPLAGLLGFQPLPAAFFTGLGVMLVLYLTLIDVGKRFFYHHPLRRPLSAPHTEHHLRRRASHFSSRRP